MNGINGVGCAIQVSYIVFLIVCLQRHQLVSTISEGHHNKNTTTTTTNIAMTSLIPDAAIIAEAERLVLTLKTHAGSLADQTRAVRQLDKLRCLLHSGPDALMFHAQPVCRCTHTQER